MRGVEDYTPIADAVEETRNTVAAAVDGGAGPEDVTLLADLYRLRRNVTAYDPVLLSSLERGVEAVLGAGRARLVRGSVTGFGRHVPYTDLVVPHPGPWARDRGPSGLAYSLEYVLGHHSTAHILLDNEVSAAENSQSVQLLAGIEEVNRRYRDVPGYVPLRAYASSPVTQSRGDRYGRVHDYTELGGVRLRIRHQPPYRLVTVTRGHSLPAAGSTAAAPTTVTTSSSYSTAYPAYPTASASSSTTTASAYPSYSATSTYPMYSTYSTGSRNSGRSGGTAYPAYSTGGSSRGPVFPGANAAWNSPDPQGTAPAEPLPPRHPRFAEYYTTEDWAQRGEHYERNIGKVLAADPETMKAARAVIARLHTALEDVHGTDSADRAFVPDPMVDANDHLEHLMDPSDGATLDELMVAIANAAWRNPLDGAVTLSKLWAAHPHLNPRGVPLAPGNGSRYTDEEIEKYRARGLVMTDGPADEVEWLLRVHQALDPENSPPLWFLDALSGWLLDHPDPRRRRSLVEIYQASHQAGVRDEGMPRDMAVLDGADVYGLVDSLIEPRKRLSGLPKFARPSLTERDLALPHRAMYAERMAKWLTPEVTGDGWAMVSVVELADLKKPSGRYGYLVPSPDPDVQVPGETTRDSRRRAGRSSALRHPYPDLLKNNVSEELLPSLYLSEADYRLLDEAFSGVTVNMGSLRRTLREVVDEAFAADGNGLWFSMPLLLRRDDAFRALLREALAVPEDAPDRGAWLERLRGRLNARAQELAGELAAELPEHREMAIEAVSRLPKELATAWWTTLEGDLTGSPVPGQKIAVGALRQVTTVRERVLRDAGRLARRGRGRPVVWQVAKSAAHDRTLFADAPFTQRLVYAEPTEFTVRSVKVVRHRGKNGEVYEYLRVKLEESPSALPREAWQHEVIFRRLSHPRTGQLVSYSAHNTWEMAWPLRATILDRPFYQRQSRDNENGVVEDTFVDAQPVPWNGRPLVINTHSTGRHIDGGDRYGRRRYTPAEHGLFIKRLLDSRHPGEKFALLLAECRIASRHRDVEPAAQTVTDNSGQEIVYGGGTTVSLIPRSNSQGGFASLALTAGPNDPPATQVKFEPFRPKPLTAHDTDAAAAARSATRDLPGYADGFTYLYATAEWDTAALRFESALGRAMAANRHLVDAARRAVERFHQFFLDINGDDADAAARQFFPSAGPEGPSPLERMERLLDPGSGATLPELMQALYATARDRLNGFTDIPVAPSDKKARTLRERGVPTTHEVLVPVIRLLLDYDGLDGVGDAELRELTAALMGWLLPDNRYRLFDILQQAKRAGVSATPTERALSQADGAQLYRWALDNLPLGQTPGYLESDLRLPHHQVYAERHQDLAELMRSAEPGQVPAARQSPHPAYDIALGLLAGPDGRLLDERFTGVDPRTGRTLLAGELRTLVDRALDGRGSHPYLLLRDARFRALVDAVENARSRGEDDRTHREDIHRRARELAGDILREIPAHLNMAMNALELLPPVNGPVWVVLRQPTAAETDSSSELGAVTLPPFAEVHLSERSAMDALSEEIGTPRPGDVLVEVEHSTARDISSVLPAHSQPRARYLHGADLDVIPGGVRGGTERLTAVETGPTSAPRPLPFTDLPTTPTATDTDWYADVVLREVRVDDHVLKASVSPQNWQRFESAYSGVLGMRSYLQRAVDPETKKPTSHPLPMPSTNGPTLFFVARGVAGGFEMTLSGDRTRTDDGGFLAHLAKDAAQEGFTQIVVLANPLDNPGGPVPSQAGARTLPAVHASGLPVHDHSGQYVITPPVTAPPPRGPAPARLHLLPNADGQSTAFTVTHPPQQRSDSSGTGQGPQDPVFPGVDAAWNSPGSGSRRSGSGGSGSGRRRTPVLVAFDRFGDAREVSWAEVESSAWFAELHPAHRERLRGVEDYTPIADAVEETRNTVAAAVDGGAGPEDVTLLADLYRLRRNVTAYDPVLLSSLERGVEAVLGAGRARLVRGSVTGFGRHVPYTDLVVPHPGPWARDRGPSGLAYSLEYVLGHHSTAHILLDNEVSAAENSQSVQLLAGIEEVNRRYRDVPGYVPLRAYASSPVTQSRGDRYGRVHDYTELGGVRLRIRHQPPYRLVTVTRGHSLPAAGSTAAAPTTVTTSSSYSTAYPAYPTASASSSTTTASAYPSYSATSTYPMYSTYSTGSRNSGRSGGTAYPAYSTGGSSRGPVFPGANAAWNSPD
ncbi:hypothetical protein, partial [Streptomyces carminius]|uniref:hypothetical protein n=1 Tax=Streptomyces carminius TaxID=2665496 RepID=UPI0018EB568E